MNVNWTRWIWRAMRLAFGLVRRVSGIKIDPDPNTMAPLGTLSTPAAVLLALAIVAAVTLAVAVILWSGL